MRKKIIEERFWEKVDKNGPNGCWIWISHKQSTGYGYFGIGSRIDGSRSKILAHRYSYELIKGPIPDNMTIDHLCRNKVCVNPAHLEVVTRKENVLRGIGLTAQNAHKTHCIHGHPFDLINTRFYINGRGESHRICRICNKKDFN